MRKELLVDQETETKAINQLASKLIYNGYNADNSVIVSVSTDYSSITGQIIRHALSENEEIAYGFGVDVPYPDQTWDKEFVSQASNMFLVHKDAIKDKNIILVEAGVIRGSNYKSLIELIKSLGFDNQIITTTLYENITSAFKSYFVVSYYDNDTQDLTFWWEKDNKHWK
jgi:hypothetical protein